jgi:outer membrane protein TolC
MAEGSTGPVQGAGETKSRMSASGRTSRTGAFLAGLCLLSVPRNGEALQPLTTFVDAARTHSPDAHELEANIDAQNAQSELALARLSPNVSLQGAYQRNEYAVVLPLALLNPRAPPTATLTLTPANEFDLTFALGVPLVDVASYWRLGAAKLGIESAKFQLDATRLQVEAQVVQSYYQVVADLALLSTSQRALDLAKASDKVTRDRVALGRSPMLEQDRADAQVEQQVQQLAQAQLLLDTATQSLESLSGIKPDLGTATIALDDDLHDEKPWESFLSEQPTPAVAATVSARAAAQRQIEAAWYTLLPVLSGSFSEHDGNYPGFSGKDSAWNLGLALRWSLDFSAYAGLHAQRANLAASLAREDRVRIALRDAVHNSWAAVRAAIARSRSARVQVTVTRHAEELAQTRYEAGSSTQLDLLQAQRDSFAADVARIQADADLVNARAQLRLAAGIDPLSVSGGAP